MSKKNYFKKENSAYNSKTGLLLTCEFQDSEALERLTKTAFKMFRYLYRRLKWGTYNKEWKAINNGKLEVANSTFMKDLNIKGIQSVIDGKNLLIEVGLWKLTREGSANMSNMYKILYNTKPGNVCRYEEERWRKYPKKNWRHEINKKPNNLIGAKTRFKKGVSGNPKYQNHPKKIDCNKSSKIDQRNGIKSEKDSISLVN